MVLRVCRKFVASDAVHHLSCICPSLIIACRFSKLCRVSFRCFQRAVTEISLPGLSTLNSAHQTVALPLNLNPQAVPKLVIDVLATNTTSTAAYAAVAARKTSFGVRGLQTRGSVTATNKTN